MLIVSPATRPVALNNAVCNPKTAFAGADRVVNVTPALLGVIVGDASPVLTEVEPVTCTSTN